MVSGGDGTRRVAGMGLSHGKPAIAGPVDAPWFFHVRVASGDNIGSWTGQAYLPRIAFDGFPGRVHQNTTPGTARDEIAPEA